MAWSCLKWKLGTYLILFALSDTAWAGGIEFFDFAPSDTPLAHHTRYQPKNFELPPLDALSSNALTDNFPSYEEVVRFNAEISSNFSSPFKLRRGESALRAPFFKRNRLMQRGKKRKSPQASFGNITESRTIGHDEEDLDVGESFSVFKITVDGSTPFVHENHSEIIYDSFGDASEVVVFADPLEEDNLDFIEDSPAIGGSTYKFSLSSGYGHKSHKGHSGYGHDDHKGHSGYGHDDHKGHSGYGHDDHKGHSGYGHDDHKGHKKESRGYHDDHHSGYGHSSHGHSGYGHHDDHHSGYGHDDHHGHGGYGHSSYHSPHKKPGPYGYGKPNYKCKYAKETLYVSKLDYSFDKKCFYVYKTDCKYEYAKGKDIGYKKECSEFSVTKCRTVYGTSHKTKCWTTYKKVCEDTYITKIDWDYKEKCSTSYEKACSGYGYHKKCHDVPKEHCKQVPVKVEKKIPKTKCKKVPEKKCKDIPFFVPKKECKHFPKTICVKDPINVKKSIPKKVCFSIPKEKCNKIPVEFLKHVPKTVKKKVCVSTKTKYHDDHHDSYHDDHHGYHANIHEVYRESPDHIEVESKTVGSSSPSLAVAAATSSPSVQKQLSTAETAEQESEPQKSDQVSRALSALRALGVRGSRSRIGGRLRLRAQRARGGRGGITTTSGKRVSSRLKAIKISKPKQRKQSSETETGTALGGNSASFFPPPPRQPKHVQSAVPADIGGMGQTKAANPGLGGGFPGFPGGFEFPEFGSFTKKK